MFLARGASGGRKAGLYKIRRAVLIYRYYEAGVPCAGKRGRHTVVNSIVNLEIVFEGMLSAGMPVEFYPAETMRGVR